jgi:hypothetical protein
MIANPVKTLSYDFIFKTRLKVAFQNYISIARITEMWSKFQKI